MSAEDLINAFGRELSVTVTDENRFGSKPLGRLGVCDGNEGVQWNTSFDLHDNTAYVAVNLEGLKYDDWPIARFIEREYRNPSLFEVARRLTSPGAVQLIFHRDAWQVASRPAIEERHIGMSGRVLPEIDPEGWEKTLEEAYRCLDRNRDHRHRAQQTVTTKVGLSNFPYHRTCSFGNGSPMPPTSSGIGHLYFEVRRTRCNRFTTT